MLSKRIKTLIGAGLLLSAYAVGAAATVRYVEIRSTLQPGTTGQGPCVSSGTVKELYTDTVTVRQNLNASVATMSSATISTVYSTSGTFSGILSGKGVTNGGNADVGWIGQYVSSSTLAINGPALNVWGDIISIPLTAGDWDVAIGCVFTLNGATGLDDLFIGASTTAGNSWTGMVAGISQLELAFPIGIQPTGYSLPRIRISISSPATAYLKVFLGGYSGGPIKVAGGITARRVR